MSRQPRIPAPQPVLITVAARSFDEEFAARRRRYTLIMAARIPCLVLAGVFGIGFGWTLAAVVLIVASVPLPWMAVLIANDGPPRKAEQVSRFRRESRRLDRTAHHVLEPVETIDASVVLDHVLDAPVDHPTHRRGQADDVESEYDPSARRTP